MAIKSTTKEDGLTGGGVATYVADHVDELRAKLAEVVLHIDPYCSPSASPIHVNAEGKFQATVTWFGLGN